MSDDDARIHPLPRLMQRFTVDWLDRADTAVPGEIMDPGYTISIGGVVMSGLDAYVEATSGQLARFPGLTVTVHELVATTGGAAAMYFTEHGGSVRGGAAAWRGVGLFFSDGKRLLRNTTEEDYLGRRRQLLACVPDPVDPPAVAPWTEVPGDPDPVAEAAVRAWLEGGGPTGQGSDPVCDDGAAGPLLDVRSCEVRELFGTGGRVAFHAVQHGRYTGGLPDADSAIGRDVQLSVVGLVRPADGGGVTGHVVRDRLGLRRELTT